MYNTNKYEAIIFDMDGTVLQSEGLFTRAEIMLLDDYGVSASAIDLDEFRGVSPNLFYMNLKKKYNISEDTTVLRKKLIEYLYQMFADDLKYMDGFKYFFKNHIIDNKIKTALVTNTSRNIVNKVNEYTNIDSYFKTIITSDDVINHKPHPEPYLMAMNILGVVPYNTLIIEDSKVGIISAIKSEADVIGIQTTLSKNDFKDINTDILSFSEYSCISNFLIK